MGGNRRSFIEGCLACLAMLGRPAKLWAGNWPEAAFEATDSDRALAKLFGGNPIRASDDIELGAPLVAENGAMVPVSVSTTLPGVQSISLVVANNPRPLAAHFEIPAGTLPDIACRIKMAETSDLTAVVRTGDGLFSASAVVKVTLGGCA